jgi:hypothetical protein
VTVVETNFHFLFLLPDIVLRADEKFGREEDRWRQIGGGVVFLLL